MKCIKCDEEIKGYGKKFCSRSCSASFNNKGYDRHHRKKVVKKFCKNCNKEINGKHRDSSIYCNNKCFHEHRWYERVKRIESGEIFEMKAMKKYVLLTRESKCVECGQSNSWNGKPLTLQVDHIDGNSDNNSLENLRILCPNCHTQTETWCARNIKNTKRNSYLKKYKKHARFA